MYNNIIDEFKKISSKGWIKGEKRGTGSVGLTFEKELKKKPDSLFFPDVNGTEIKCTTRFSKYPFSLFSVAFEGPTFPEIQRIIDLYGYWHYKFKDKKVLKVDLNAIERHKCGNYKFKLFIGDRVYLEVYDLNDNLIERKSYIYIETLIDHLNLKLTNLAIIHASKKVINNDIYFRYYKIEVYKLRKDIFIKLLLEGKIFATLESRIGMSGKFEGLYKNKNLVFKIKREYLEDLFEKKYIVDLDKGIDRLFENNNFKNFYIMN